MGNSNGNTVDNRSTIQKWIKMRKRKIIRVESSPSFKKAIPVG
jgi:hypothetical protein